METGFGSIIRHGLFVGWVEHPGIFCWVSFPQPNLLTNHFFAVSETQQNDRRYNHPQKTYID